MRIFDSIPPAESYIPLSAIARALLRGPDDFEQDLQSFLGVKHCILFSSGKASLCRLLVALRESDDAGRKQVLIPGYTCYSVAASVVKAGLEIRCYDLDPHTFWPDEASVKALAGNQTLAIIGQHLFGIPTPMEGLRETAESTGSYLIEDAAQALGGAYKGTPLGTLGDFGILSFGRGKPLPLGSGGAIMAKKGEILQEIEKKQGNNGYSSFAAAAVTQLISKPYLYWIAEMLPLGLGETIFDPGFPVQSMPHTMKRLGKIALRELDNLNAHRCEIAGIYQEAIQDMKTPPVPPESTPVFTRYPVSAGNNPISKSLLKLGVRRMYPRAILEEPSIQPYCSQDRATTKGASEISRTLITLPTHRDISREIALEVSQSVRQAYNENYRLYHN